MLLLPLITEMVNRDIKTADAFSVYGCRLEETVGGNHRLPWYDCVRRYPEYSCCHFVLLTKFEARVFAVTTVQRSHGIKFLPVHPPAQS